MYRKSWSLYNYLNKVDITMGICNVMLHAMGPYAMAIPLDAEDPNVESSYQKYHLEQYDREGQTEPCYLPRYIKAVRKE